MTDLDSRYTNFLRTQAKTADSASESLPCPFCNEGRIFQSGDQLWSHASLDHKSDLQILGKPDRARAQLLRRSKALADQSSDATAGGGSTLDLAQLSLDTPGKDRSSTPLDPRVGEKRPAGLDYATAPTRQSKIIGKTEVYDPDYSRDMPYTLPAEPTRSKPSTSRLYDPKQDAKAGSPYLRSTPAQSSEDWSVEANKSQYPTGHHHSSSTHSPHSQRPPANIVNPTSPSRGQYASPQRQQPGLLEIQRFDPRYPGLLLQPDSRPISQEQLASEVKSIYAGLTMVETKCIHVDRAQASAAQGSDADRNPKLANDHWQALIALHRTLLHEHHDFFLASQHPSASPALRRLASKYSMPARMWKHGIHSFLELLRRRLPESLDYMLAFIYLAYQMMALLYETVPAFEDTWIECLGDLGRYRMAIEDEDIRDRETWASVARSWYSKAANKNPSVGRLYHHLAILARPNALHQLYYYARSLTCVKPFPSARESILTLLDPILGRPTSSYSHALPIDTSFIQAHGILFEKLPFDQFEEARLAFLGQLDNHIGRVTAKWKEQGVYIAVTNIASLFDYGADSSILRRVLQFYSKKLALVNAPAQSSGTSDDGQSRAPSPMDTDYMTESDIPNKIDTLSTDFTFSGASVLTYTTLTLVLRRIGDKNVLPHVYVLLSFLASFASIPYVSHLISNAPWTEIVVFLNTLLKSERPEQPVSTPVFLTEDQGQNDAQPLPEDHLIRGQIWSQWYFPENWFRGEYDEEERSLELASTIKSRTERILRLGYRISSFDRWMSFDQSSNTFSIIDSMGS